MKAEEVIQGLLKKWKKEKKKGKTTVFLNSKKALETGKKKILVRKLRKSGI